MNKDLQAILNFVQQSEHLNEDEKKSILKSLKDANKEIEITAFKLDRTEKVKRTTAILLEETIEELEQKRKAVEAQNKELEIESSLERVRTVAMGMRKADDLLDVCQSLFTELRTLGFDELRNAMINIFNNDSISFLNYDYSDNAGKTITTHYYNTHPVIEKQVKEIRSSRDAFSETVFSGKDLEEWRAFRKEKGEKDDPKLDSIAALFYYFYAIGTGAIGISTYSSITNEKRNVLKRFRNVFDLAYRRFIDIENAEAQAREAQIEASLERVRSKTMAMHSSDDVGDTVAAMFNEFVRLGIQTNRCGISIFSDETSAEVWIAKSNPEGKANLIIGKLDLTVHALLHGIHKAWKKKETFYTYTMEGDDLRNYYQALNDLEYYPVKFDMSALPLKEFHSEFYFPEGSVFAFTGQLIPEEHTKIIKRFASVFGQTYRRYLDLQKAEAQVREAQVQLALERVRARTMAMQKQNDLLGVLDLLVEQLVKLGVNLQVANFSNGIPGGDWDLWIEVAADDGTIFNNYVHFPRIEHPYFLHVEKNIETYRKDGTNLFKDVFSKEEKDSWQHYINTQTIYKDLTPEDIRQSMYEKPGYIWSMVILKDTWVSICRFNTIPFSDDEDALLRRFANAFGQTYTRFLDLQKAEAQARESQIQLALERVRARTMAMQHSNELAETASILFQQIKNLGFETWSCGFCIWKDDTTAEAWMGADAGGLLPPLMIPYKEEQTHHEIYKAHLQEIQSYDHVWEGKDLENHYAFLKTIPSVKEAIDLMEKSGLVLPQRQCYYVGFFKKGYLLLITKERNDELKELSQRLAQVFDLTYTRFLDLQKAEAQAREAQIEVALERVRSRSMGMQKSEELSEVIQIVYNQFVHLNIPAEHTGFVMDYKTRGDYKLWIADRFGSPSQVTIPYFDSIYYNSFNKAKEKGIDFFITTLTFEEKNKFYEELFKHVPGLPDESQKIIFNAPGYSISTALLENVSLYIENFTGIPFSNEENAILIRFGKVFQQTYTRFLDLQKAEAQALEAIKRASVDRVRAEIASMRTTKDLQRIQPLIWNELTTLSIPFTRCGVFIMDDDEQHVHTFLSNPEGKAIATLHIPFNFDFPLTTNGISHWRRKEVYKEYWDAAAFTSSWALLSTLSDGTGNSHQQEQAPENLYLHLLPFVQGMLYVGNDTPLTEMELQLVQNLADAFATAYARYEDFNKLEGAKKQVDSALNELQAAQKQLIQSEKMASLGELTAGIAHEIQNPLNFVNNFSDVNKELLAELNEEIEKGNYEEVKTIAADIAGNEEKINHHGKRADSIVKGMLQHSRSTANVKELTDISVLADEYFRLAYHGLRAKEKTFNAALKTDYDQNIGKINIIPQDISRVILNVITNAFYTINEKKKQQGNGYEPTVSVSTKKTGDTVEIKITDNGNGIPQKIVDKIFQPFFTTKPTGQGTGLGLSLAYDIVKAHGGELKVETKEGEGSVFIIQIPNSI